MTPPTIPQPNYTQTPNVLFDALLPTLKYAELKVLLWLVRQTFGWHETWTGGKRSASIRTTVKGTGLSSPAVRAAFDSLEARGLVEWRKGQGDNIEWRIRTTATVEEGKLLTVEEGKLLAVEEGKLLAAIKEPERTEDKRLAQNGIAPPPANPSPPEALVKAVPTDPNGTATQAKPNGVGKPKSRKSSAPPATLGPGSLVYRDVIHLTPNHAQREILDAAHAAHGEASMRAVMVAWLAHGYSPKNVAGMVEAINAGGLRFNGHNGAGSRANGKPLSAMVLEI